MRLHGLMLSRTCAIAAGSTAAAVGQISGVAWVDVLAGWLFVSSAVAAWYTASALMLEGSFGRTILPVMKLAHSRKTPKFNVGIGEPGVMHGQ